MKKKIVIDRVFLLYKYLRKDRTVGFQVGFVDAVQRL